MKALHIGGHTDAPNWPAFLKFAGGCIQAASVPADSI
jgi:hypothetical protein